jgi:hypothetical protein
MQNEEREGRRKKTEWRIPEGRMKHAEKDLAERTKKFARRIIRLFVALPREPVAQVLGKQALRAGTAVGANYRETYFFILHSSFCILPL